MADEVLLTQRGFEDLEERLHYLKAVKRVDVSQKIKVAREFGDLSENAEYDAAKDEQGMVEAEINDIECKLRVVKIIDDVTDTSIVTLGCKVLFENLSNNMKMEYQIVGTTESDPFKMRISNESPIGKAMLNRKKGETISFNGPNGIMKIKILDIKA